MERNNIKFEKRTYYVRGHGVSICLARYELNVEKKVEETKAVRLLIKLLQISTPSFGYNY